MSPLSPSIIIPFLGTIADFNQNGRNDLEMYMLFINEIDQGINYVIQNQDESYLKEIEYPPDLNISFYVNIAKYEFFIDGQHCVKIEEYNGDFFNSHFHQIYPGTYLLNISRYFSLIKVNIYNLN